MSILTKSEIEAILARGETVILRNDETWAIIDQASEIPSNDGDITTGIETLSISQLLNCNAILGYQIQGSPTDGYGLFYDDALNRMVWLPRDATSGAGTVSSGVAKRFAFYPSDGTTIDDAQGVDYQSGASPTVLITSQANNFTALEVAGSATPSVAQVRFRDSATSGYFDFTLSTTPNLFIFSAFAEGFWNGAYLNLTNKVATQPALFEITADNYTDYFSVYVNPAGTDNSDLTNIPHSSLISTNAAQTGGLVLNTVANAPIILSTGGFSLTTEKGRFDSNGLTLGKASSVTGALRFAHTSSANLATFTPSNFTGSRILTIPDVTGTLMTTAGGTFTGSVVYSAAIVSTPVVLTDAATIDTDAALGNRFEVSSATDRTLGAPTNATHGQQCSWTWKNTDSNPHTLTLTTGSAGAFRYNGTIIILPATAAGKKIKFTAEYSSTDARWDVIGYVNDI